MAAVALTLLVTTTTACKRNELDPFGSGWRRLPLAPLAGASYLQDAETSPCVWEVQMQGNKLAIQQLSLKRSSPPPDIRFQITGRMLIGTDGGENGGSLSVIEGANKLPRKILSVNVLQMIPTQGGVAVITGDLQENQGSVWVYSKSAHDGWSVQKRADLHGFPMITGQSGNRILFAYIDGVSVMKDFKESFLATLPLLRLKPNSIAQGSDGNVYLGMRGLVVRLVPDRNGYSQQWFTKPYCLRGGV